MLPLLSAYTVLFDEFERRFIMSRKSLYPACFVRMYDWVSAVTGSQLMRVATQLPSI